MKRFCRILLVVFLSFLLTACGAASAETTIPSTAPPVTEPAQTTLPPAPTVPETTAPAPIETVDYGPLFQNMSLKDIQYWFFDFARLYCLDQMPTIHPEHGPSMHSGSYAFWVYARNAELFRGDIIEMPRELLDQEVLTHFGIQPEEYETDPYTWAYDEEREIFSYPYNPYILPDPNYYMLSSIEYSDGIYTVHATNYSSRFDKDNAKMALELKRQLFQGDTRKLIASAEITLRFQLDPDTLVPLFHSYVKQRYNDFP